MYTRDSYYMGALWRIFPLSTPLLTRLRATPACYINCERIIIGVRILDPDNYLPCSQAEYGNLPTVVELHRLHFN